MDYLVLTSLYNCYYILQLKHSSSQTILLPGAQLALVHKLQIKDVTSIAFHLAETEH